MATDDTRWMNFYLIFSFTLQSVSLPPDMTNAYYNLYGQTLVLECEASEKQKKKEKMEKNTKMKNVGLFMTRTTSSAVSGSISVANGIGGFLP